MTNLSSSHQIIQLKEYGIESEDIKFGINKDGFNNEANPYFVYRASVRDSNEVTQNEVAIDSCLFDEQK